MAKTHKKRPIDRIFGLKPHSLAVWPQKQLFLPFLGFFTLGGILNFSGIRAWEARNCPGGGKLGFRAYSPDTQDSKKWLVGYLTALYDGLRSQNRKLANRCNGPKNRENHRKKSQKSIFFLIVKNGFQGSRRVSASVSEAVLLKI